MKGSMLPYEARPFRGPDDLRRMREMVVQASASGAPGCWHVGDLIWRYFLLSIRSNPHEDVRLWEDAEGQLLGFAWIDAHNLSFDWQAQPAARWQGLEEEMLRWVEGRGRRMKQSPGRAPTQQLNTGAMADDEPRVAFLRQNGFEPEGGGLVHMEQRLDDLPLASPPPGYVLRAVAGPHEAAARAALHRLAFHPSRVDDESYRRLMGLPGYDLALDVVAVGPDGTFAAFALGWVDTANRVGEFEPVGTAPASRRLGLARAVLLEGLRRMRAEGAEAAIVAAWAESTPARELYQSVGFKIVNHEFELTRPR